ncbi:MAG TPA: DNA recombination protein RmuC, partial [Vicinamibacterales bacterium]|nr:DNA recombination protein RmuC [Vicinamibacterales bacterium]
MVVAVLSLALGTAAGALWMSSRSRAAYEIALQEKASLAAALDAERRSATEKISLLQDAETKLRDAFSSLSSEALRANSESFLRLARASLGEFQKTATMDLDGKQKAIDALVQPLRESLTRVDAKLNEVDRGRASSQAQLSEQLRSMTQAQQVLHSETSKLARALRSSNTRGEWGEIQLRRVLECANLVEGMHFDIKDSAQSEGGRLTPDVIVKLPGGKNVIVDAKVALSAYLDAMDCEDDAGRDAKLKDHARQVKDHVNRLGNKSYWAHFQPAPDIVVMFVPGEALLSAALQHDNGLLEFSMNKGVMLASPLTLIALLKAIAYGWQQDTIAKNAQEISELGRNLYDRIAKLAEHFENVGRSLAKAVQSYNGAVGTLETRVLVTARRLKDKGVTASEEFREIETIDTTPRLLGAPELVGLFDDVAADDGPADDAATDA